MAVGDIREVRFIMLASDQLGLNIRHYRVAAEAAPAATNLQIAEFLNTAFRTLYLSLLSSGAQFIGVGVKQLAPPPASMESISTPAPSTGIVAGDPLPRQVSGIITLRSLFAGRSRRGRAYIPFPAESDSTGIGRPGVGYIAQLANLANAFTLQRVVPNGAGSTTLDPVIFTRRTASFTNIATAVARSIWATQRRRGDYGRPNVIPPQ